MRFLFVVFLLGLFAGCSTTPVLKTSDTVQIIKNAADSAPDGVQGVYTFTIQATGSQRGDNRIFLNTEIDYRDQRNITIALSFNAVKELIAATQQSPEDYFKGKTIQVTGEAKRVKIHFTTMGRRTGKYYYQTHIKVTDASQIMVV
ncbi:hypothetical protein Q4574_05305 [Aliiglaciecola sp. 3_MG-2023]|uniref:hypothetical protein n=1 Tax=unclassified Aliiglaciecola TaxID=2593648 RepID=UPI0026E42308|nr:MULTISPECIES: hypothetical protein [unclassified Aliiglaciecola]MDO6692688.1 hypothetical protein [Aliiglaciecola sp. 3_MG-2023]MDO6713420.1 hypothetical protein [Aliiglaciecola sp. 2_MG-2023]MDO6754554.1 hypothetical protein [Aliiglaciecola sp. 1_MG-2023]